MKKFDFRMERPDLLKVGDQVHVSESVLTTLQGRMYYYTIDPALAMSKNIPAKDKLECFEGTVVEIEDKGALWNIWVEFDD